MTGERGRTGFLSFGVALPLIAFYFSQYGYSPLYGSNTLTRDGYVDQYDDGIYRYRLLGKELVLWVNDHLGSTMGSVIGNRPAWTTEAVPDFDSGLFASHALVNGAAYLVMSVLLFDLLRRSLADRGLVVYLALQLLVLASGWVITPYDFPSYALLVAAIWCFRRAHPAALWATPLVVAVGTLNRETQALAVAFMLVAVFLGAGKVRRDVVLLTSSAAAFLAVYVGLRVAMGARDGVLQEVTVTGQGLQSWIGLLVGLAALAVTYSVATWATGTPDPQVALLAFAAMSPYLLVSFLGGFYLEFRLFVPVLLVEALAVCLLGRVAQQAADGQPRSPETIQ